MGGCIRLFETVTVTVTVTVGANTTAFCCAFSMLPNIPTKSLVPPGLLEGGGGLSRWWWTSVKEVVIRTTVCYRYITCNIPTKTIIIRATAMAAASPNGSLHPREAYHRPPHKDKSPNHLISGEVAFRHSQ